MSSAMCIDPLPLQWKQTACWTAMYSADVQSPLSPWLLWIASDVKVEVKQYTTHLKNRNQKHIYIHETVLFKGHFALLHKTSISFQFSRWFTGWGMFVCVCARARAYACMCVWERERVYVCACIMHVFDIKNIFAQRKFWRKQNFTHTYIKNNNCRSQ